MKRIFSGIQPSGEIHIGNYLGAIKNWVRLIEEYESIFCIVDLHAMTIAYDPTRMQEQIFDAALVNIACGLDPEKCTMFVQSHVPYHTELTWFLNCVTPIGELERMTQFKQKSAQHRQNINMGLMDYPVLQAADILLYQAELVPVGEDQVQHIELAREISRYFNRRYGEFFKEPKALLTESARIMGTDGKTKMSKSLNNTIGILESEDVIWEKLRTAVTDEARKLRSDPGNPDICNIFTMHKGFSPAEDIEMVNRECRHAGIGCVDCKKLLYKNMMEHLAPIRQKAENLRKKPGMVRQVLEDGAKRCQSLAEKVITDVRKKVGIRQ
jgi:tryptophanyl-tRNA synthetase